MGLSNKKNKTFTNPKISNWKAKSSKNKRK